MRTSQSRRDPLPKFDIALILQELGADDVPTGFGWVRCRCPFHEDRTASAAVNHELAAFTCHSCGRKGDSLKLLQSELGLTFIEALERARRVTGQTVESSGKPVRKRRASDIFKTEG